MDERETGRRIRARRQYMGWTQTELANQMGTYQKEVSALERSNKIPTLFQLRRVADAFGLPIEHFVPLPDDSFNERLRYRRIIQEKSQQDLAESLGVSHSQVSHWELGRREPRLDQLEAIAAALETSVTWLIGEENGTTTTQT